MLKSPVSIVYVAVEHAAAIFHYMLELHWHRLDRAIENARIIYVIPSVEEFVGALKFLELLLPKFARIFIQKIHES